ncbi:hypothetical protein LC605_25245 [Nostoc sp. CHAB 5836]|uniref:hypothetical protein n=1 Tax=Nostoc sp. CHAB 5836 TaxID=2780404 RepID=UPI001E6561BA|nr:hypothetical protein [Nostoc sp. CHAB 5836]MCC5618328.1 hypothetical protein [Nostoc sp. CHAB 5836]
MSYFWRLFFSVIVALPIAFWTLPAHSSPILITQITASDFLELGVDQMQRSDYQPAIENFREHL